jgi:hypothetical protein
MPTSTANFRSELRTVRRLAAAYLAVSALTLVVVVLLRNHAGMVNDAVWVRTTIVTVSAVLTVLFATRAARGHRRSYLRLRIVTAVMPVAIAVIVALPGMFPVWLKVEQVVCGLILLAAVVIVNRKQVRSLDWGA